MLTDWLKRKIQLKAVKSAEEDIRRVLSTVKGLTDEEMGAVVATSTKLRLALVDHSLNLKELFEIPAPHTSGFFQAAMGMFGDRIRKQQSTGTLYSAAAMMIWHQSMRALVYPEITYLGKEMWREVRRGFPYAAELWSEVSLFENQITDLDLPADEIDYIPSGLAK